MARTVQQIEEILCGWEKVKATTDSQQVRNLVTERISYLKGELSLLQAAALRASVPQLGVFPAGAIVTIHKPGH